MRKSYETPCCVSLGTHDSWFVSWPGGDCAWKFNGCYIPLEKILGEATKGSVSVSYSSCPVRSKLIVRIVRRHLALQRSALLRRVQRPVCQVQLHRRPSGVDEPHDTGIRLHDHRSLANLTAAATSTSSSKRKHIPPSTSIPFSTTSAGGSILPQQ